MSQISPGNLYKIILYSPSWRTGWRCDGHMKSAVTLNLCVMTDGPELASDFRGKIVLHSPPWRTLVRYDGLMESVVTQHVVRHDRTLELAPGLDNKIVLYSPPWRTGWRHDGHVKSVVTHKMLRHDGSQGSPVQTGGFAMVRHDAQYDASWRTVLFCWFWLFWF